MKSVLFAIAGLVLAQSAAQAAPECAVIIDGVIENRISFSSAAPIPDLGEKRLVGSRFGGVQVTVDYTLKAATSDEREIAYATVGFNYLNKFGDWYVRTETAVGYDLVLDQPVLQVILKNEYLIPAEDNQGGFGLADKEIKVQCNLKE